MPLECGGLVAALQGLLIWNAVLGPSGSGAVSKTVCKAGSNPVHRTIPNF